MGLTSFLPLIGTGVQALYNTFVGQQQSKDLMEYQYQLNQKAIRQQNQYNSPIAQMQRLREAGLNPNLVYGNGVEGNQSSAPNVGLSNRNPQLDNGLLDTTNAIFKQKQIDNETVLTSASEQKTLADKALSEARYLNEMFDLHKKGLILDTELEKAKADLAHTQQSIEESRQRVNESTQRVSNLQSQANLLQEQIKYWDSHAKNESELMPDLLRARMWQSMQAGNLSEAQTKVAETIAKLNDKKIEQLTELILGIQLDNGNKAIEFKLNDAMDRLGITGMKPKDFLNVIVQLLK